MTWLVLGLVASLPSLAEAQLFPDRTIRRERPPCSTETPFNAQVRREYFGYYPTCWSKFPEGWRCPGPNPELPDLAASLAKQKFDPGRTPTGSDVYGDPGDDGLGPMNDRRGGTQPTDPNIPAIPNPGGSPFQKELNPPANRPPGGDPFLPGANPPARPAPGPGGVTPPALPPTSRNASPPSRMEMPDLPETSPAAGLGASSSGAPRLGSGAMLMVPDATLASNASPDFDRPNLGPLPSAPLPASSVPGPVTIPDPSESDQILGRPAPAQAPRRRSLIGSLFNRGDSRNR